MAKIKEEQKVKLFPDEDYLGLQEVNIYTDDKCGPWIIISHNGDDLSLTIENWDNLLKLVEKAKIKQQKTIILTKVEELTKLNPDKTVKEILEMLSNEK